MSKKKSIAFGLDSHILFQVETVIKSIAHHTDEVRFYLFNDDIPRQWFVSLRQKLAIKNCELIDVKVTEEDVNRLKSWNPGSLGFPIFYRYLIPRYIEEDTVLYLDCDTIVSGDISPLFDIDLKDYYVGAVEDFDNYEPNLTERYFNSGVLLFNNKLCRRDKITDTLIKETQTRHEMIHYGDQSVLNFVFAGKWLELGAEYNYLVATEAYAISHGMNDKVKFTDGTTPTIIHFVGPYKPWKLSLTVRFEDIWWYYNGLEWHHIVMGTEPVTPQKKQLLIVTQSADLPHLDFLLENLPEYNIHVAAYTNFAPSLLNKARFENCCIYPGVTSIIIEELVNKVDAYLELNAHSDLNNITNRFLESGRFVFGYRERLADQAGKILVDLSNPQDLVRLIKERI